jgi:hypothetical protein
MILPNRAPLRNGESTFWSLHTIIFLRRMLITSEMPRCS